MTAERIHRPTSALTLLFIVGLVGTVAGAPAAEESQPSAPVVQEESTTTLPSDAMAPSPTVQEESATPTEAGEIQERGVLRIPVPGVKPLDAFGQRPTTAVPDNRYVAPTANLTMVANALRLNHKSLTTLITAAPNLPVNQPVEISIGYYSPAGNQRITQSYVRSSGNRFLYNDREGDGKARTLRVDITLSEPKSGGGVITFALLWQANLDPLYDVSISPLNFSLIDNCDLVGNSEINFVWWAPDDPPAKPHTFAFTTRVGRSTTINQFAWTRTEISALAQLREVPFYFWEKDSVHPTMGFLAPQDPTVNNLVPGKTKVFKGNLTDQANSNKKDCRAYYEYTITYTLRSYPYL